MPRRLFCRSDPRFANVIVRPDGRYGFVDWEDAGLRDPTLEVADLMVHPEQEDLLTEGECQAFLLAYCEAMGFEPKAFAQSVDDYRFVFSVFWVLIMMRYGIRLSRSGQLADWRINELPANLRLQRYLARALAKSPGDFDVSQYAGVRFFPT
jgi:thiamine kinase-like enzyme